MYSCNPWHSVVLGSAEHRGLGVGIVGCPESAEDTMLRDDGGRNVGRAGRRTGLGGR